MLQATMDINGQRSLMLMHSGYFRESGIFNPEVADSFRKNILEKGESDKPMNLYVKFRGREPSMDAFLERSGLK